MRPMLINQSTLNYYKLKSEQIDIIPYIVSIIGICIWMLYYRYLSKNNKKKEIKIL